MKLLFKKLLLFALFVFVLDKLFYVFLLNSPSLEKDKRLEKILEGQMNKEAYIMGSSRGDMSLLPENIEDSLGLTTYNLSFSGSTIVFQEYILRALLQHNKKPKIIFLVIDDQGELQYIEALNYRFDRLYPLAKYNYVNTEMIRHGKKNFLSNYFVLARINRMNFQILEENTESKKIDKATQIKMAKAKREFFFNTKEPVYDINKDMPDKKAAFASFQKLCVDNNISLYIVIPPNFKYHNPYFEANIKSKTHKDVSVIVYDTLNQLYKDKTYFQDTKHLNKKGATLLTNEVIARLRKDGF